MNLDLSTAPEIAQLAGPGAPLEPFGCKKGSNRLTAGGLAALVREAAADPARWWSRVRFDPERPVRTRLDAAAGWELWLVTTPPGHRSGWYTAGRALGAQRPACEVLTVVAGELAEYTDGAEMRRLRANRVRVRGHLQRRETVNHGGCYAVSLHAWS